MGLGRPSVSSVRSPNPKNKKDLEKNNDSCEDSPNLKKNLRVNVQLKDVKRLWLTDVKNLQQ